MRLLRTTLIVLTCAALIAVGALVFLLQMHPDFSVTQRPAQPTGKAVRMLFLGTSSMADRWAKHLAGRWIFLAPGGW